MNFYLDFPSVSVFAMSIIDNVPHCKLNVERMRLKWLKDQNNDIVIAIYGDKINIRFYEKLGNDHLIEKTLLGEDILQIQKIKL